MKTRCRELFGVAKFADESQVRQWLRSQSEESGAALRKLLHEFMSRVWRQAHASINPPRAGEF